MMAYPARNLQFRLTKRLMRCGHAAAHANAPNARIWNPRERDRVQPKRHCSPRMQLPPLQPTYRSCGASGNA